jgi:DnaJ-class molecular chaperone
MPVLADALEEAGIGDVECDTCGGSGMFYTTWRETVMQKNECQSCHGIGRLPHPILSHLRPKLVECSHHFPEGDGGWMTAEDCQVCNGTGFRTVERQHVRGCHVLDCLLGKE